MFYEIKYMGDPVNIKAMAYFHKTTTEEIESHMTKDRGTMIYDDMEYNYFKKANPVWRYPLYRVKSMDGTVKDKLTRKDISKLTGLTPCAIDYRFKKIDKTIYQDYFIEKYNDLSVLTIDIKGKK